MNWDVRLLLKASNTAFESVNAQASSKARAKLKKGFKNAKGHNKGNVEEHFTKFNQQPMWQGLSHSHPLTTHQ